MPDYLEPAIQQLLTFLTRYGLDVVGGVVLLALGWTLAGWAARGTGRALRGALRLDETLIPIIQKTVRIVVLAVTALAVLNKFGVETASIIAVLGTGGLALGLALQGTLSNLAAGVMVLLLRPLALNEIVEVHGIFGYVEEVGLFHTKLRTFEGQTVFMPNQRLWSQEIRNYSRSGVRRVDLVISIGYGEDLRRALALASEVVRAHPDVLSEPEPMTGVGELAESSVDLWVRPWVHPEKYITTKMALTQAIKERFDLEGVVIPFPQRDIHIHAPRANAFVGAVSGREEPLA